ncbi:MAG: tRNA (adenosine(37)-N6)-threonylcarbamoyltransferase complex ATPase subunit type 1 TsaE [bacterium]
MCFITHSEQETKNIGKKIATKLKGGEVLALSGDLGAGKTVLTKGIAEGLGYRRIVNSPTFVLMKVYKIRYKLLNIKLLGKIEYICHIDGYRIIYPDEIENVGALEYFNNPHAVSIVEWPEKIKKFLPKNTIWIDIKYGNKENERIIDMRK